MKRKKRKIVRTSIISLAILGVLSIFNNGSLDLGFLNPNKSIEVNSTIDNPKDKEVAEDIEENNEKEKIPEIKIIDDEIYLNEELIINIDSLPQKIIDLNVDKKVKLNSTKAKVITFKSVENILNENDIIIIEIIENN